MTGFIINLPNPLTDSLILKYNLIFHEIDRSIIFSIVFFNIRRFYES